MVIANPPLAEPVIDPGGVTIKPPFEMGVANLVMRSVLQENSIGRIRKWHRYCLTMMRIRWAVP